MSRKQMPMMFADEYSIKPGPVPQWMADPSLLPRKSVAQILAEREASAPIKRRGR